MKITKKQLIKLIKEQHSQKKIISEDTHSWTIYKVILKSGVNEEILGKWKDLETANKVANEFRKIYKKYPIYDNYKSKVHVIKSSDWAANRIGASKNPFWEKDKLKQ